MFSIDSVYYEEVLSRRAKSANTYGIEEKDVSMQQGPSSQINEGFQDEQENAIHIDIGEITGADVGGVPGVHMNPSFQVTTIALPRHQRNYLEL